MTVQDFLRAATQALKQAGVASARLDALVLLEDALGLDRAHLLAHAETKIDRLTEIALNKKIVQRAQHIPLAYVRGKVEFYGREFAINQHVLVPRPETETMIDLLKRFTKPESQVTIADIGTGSGAIALTAKLELPKASVIGVDIDTQCISISRKNATTLGTEILFLQGDLLTPICDSNLLTGDSILLANLPYVPERYTINRAAEHEPKHAIFGGKDGLNLYRRFWQQVDQLPQKPVYVLTESLPPQHAGLAAVANSNGYRLLEAQDFIQVFVPINR